MSRRATNILLVMLFCLLAGLAACASGDTPRPTAPGSEMEASQPAPKPAASETSEVPERKCLRVLLIKEPALLDEAGERLRGGESFITIAASLKAGHAQVVSDRTVCKDIGQLDQALVLASEGLDPGESAGPVKLAQGGALVRVTTDRWFQQGRMELKAGNNHLAEEAFLRDLDLNPDHVSSWHLLGLSRMARGDWPRGLDALQKGLAWAPRDAALVNDVGSALWELGRREEGLDHYLQALALSPGNPLLMNNLAWALTEQGQDLKRAEALVREALSLAPDKAAFWDTLGQVMEAQGRPALAVIAYHHSLALNKNRPGTKRRLLAVVTNLKPEEVSRLAQGEDLTPARLSQMEKAFESTASRPAALPLPRVKSRVAAEPEPEAKRFLGRSAEAPETAPEQKPAEPESRPAEQDQTEQAAASPAGSGPAPEPEPVKEPPEPLPVFEGQPVLNAPEPQVAAEPAAAQEEPQPPQAAPPEATEAQEAAEPEERPAEEQAIQETAARPEPAPTEGQGGSAWVRQWMGGDQTWQPTGQTPAPEPEPQPVPAELEVTGEVMVVMRPEPGDQPRQSAPEPAQAEPNTSAQPTQPEPAQAEPEASQPAPPQTASGVYGWYVQTASYRTLDLAQQESAQWKRRGWTCQMEHLDMGANGKWYRVMLGPYASRKEAKQAGRDLVEEGFIREFLIQHKTKE